LSSTAFSTVTYSFQAYTPTSNSISDASRSASGDSLADSSVSFGDVCTQYYPVIASEGVTNPYNVYQDFVFTSILTEF